MLTTLILGFKKKNMPKTMPILPIIHNCFEFVYNYTDLPVISRQLINGAVMLCLVGIQHLQKPKGGQYDKRKEVFNGKRAF